MAKKQVKKIWLNIVAPKVFNETIVGETTTTEPEKVVGRTVWVYYPQLSGDLTKHYIKVRLLITEVKGEQAHTKIYGYEVTRPYLARFIRRRKSKIDVIKDVSTRDEKIRMKWVVLTAYKANAAQRTAIRKKLEELIEKKIPEYSMEQLIVDIANKKLQKEFEKVLNKIYPIAFIDVRKIEVKR
jgi:small subunit ribosomal protein S3Ae